MAKKNNKSEDLNILDDSLFESGDSRANQIIDSKEVATVNRIIVPENYKAILVRQEFNPEIKNIVSQLQDELMGVGPINNQDQAARANGSLKRAKQLIKTLAEERKLMTSVLDEEKKRIMSYEEKIISDLDKLVKIINSKIEAFQIIELKKKQEEDERLRKERDAELEKARKETDRKAAIEKKILDFENGVLRACASATIDDIDEKIERLKSAKIKEDVYMEYTDLANVMYASCVLRMGERKKELVALASAKSKFDSDRIIEEQAAKAKAELEINQQKQSDLSENTEAEKQGVTANIQMEYELKASQGEEIKGVQRRWGFDPETIDMSLLPEEFKTFDEKKIKEAIAAGCREIPGVKIEQKVINTSR